MLDLHMHLDGDLEACDLKTLADLQGETLPKDYDKYNKVSNLGVSLSDYLRCFELPTKVTQTYKTLYKATEIVLNRMKEQGIIYCELRFAPQLQTLKGLSQEDAVIAVMDA